MQAGTLLESLGKRRTDGERALARVLDLEQGKLAGERLFWTALLKRMRQEAPAIAAFAEEAAGKFTQAVLLGTGSSTLLPQALARIFGSAEGSLQLRVLDSTAPEAVRAASAELDLNKTLIIVADEQGTAPDVDAFYRHFRKLIDSGAQFVAITNANSPLQRLAHSEGFWRCWLNPAELGGGGHSALSHSTLVTLALIGIDSNRLLEPAGQVALASTADAPPTIANSAVRLGALAGGLAALPKPGADKLTLVLSESLAPLGPWLAHVVTGRTARDGKGVIPVLEEKVASPDRTGADRLFVSIALAGESADSERVRKLISAGHPVLRWEIASKEALLGELVGWEISAAWMAAVLNVDSAAGVESEEGCDRALTAALLEPRAEEPALRSGGVALFTSVEYARVLRGAAGTVGAAAAGEPSHWLAAHLALAEPGDYLALLAFLPETESLLIALRHLQVTLRDKTRLATMTGIGPRFLCSTGRLHKQGPETGVFIQITAGVRDDLPIPGRPWSFGSLLLAQARADLDALLARGRRALRIHLEDGNFETLTLLVQDALKAMGK